RVSEAHPGTRMSRARVSVIGAHSPGCGLRPYPGYPLDSPLPLGERGARVRVLQAPPVAVHLRSPGKRSAPGNADVARTSIRDWGPIPPDAAFGLIRATPLDSPLPLGEARRGVRVLQAPPVVV